MQHSKFSRPEYHFNSIIYPSSIMTYPQNLFWDLG